MNKIDWVFLRRALIICCASLSIVSVLYLVIDDFHAETALQFAAQEQAHATIKRKFEEARRNRTLYQQYLAQYKRLQSNGVIGKEQRLSWIEELQILNKKYRLNGLSYEISPQRKVTLPKVNTSANVKINVSTIHLQAGLLHEGDVVSMWQELRTKTKGLFALQECELESNFRREQPITYSPYRPYVHLDCELNWYSIMAKSS